MAEPNRFARFLTESEGGAQTQPPAAENRFAQFAAEDAAPTAEPAPSRPAGGPSARGRQAVEMAQRLFGERPSTQGSETPRAESEFGSRMAGGAVMGFAAPETAMLLGRGLGFVPHPIAQGIGRTLTAGAPLIGLGGRTVGALGGMFGAGAGETARLSAQNKAGLSPEVSELIGTGVETALGAPASAAGLARRAMRSAAPTAPSVSGIKATTREAADIAAEELGRESTELSSRQLRRDLATRRLAGAPARQPATVSVNEEAALKEAKLAAPDTADKIANRTDVNSRIRQQAVARNIAAETKQEDVGGRAFSDYKAAAEELQQTTPFANSPEGSRLRQWLQTQISGGEGALRTISGEERRTFAKIRDELFPEPRRVDPSKFAGDPDALERATAQAAAEAKPASFGLVEREIRRLRDVAGSPTVTGFDSQQRAEAKKAADALENALNGWLERGAAGARPREAYAKASEDINRFRTKLGEALIGRQEVPYATGTTTPGAYQTAEQNLTSIVFRDRDTVRFSKQLMGDAFVNEMAEVHASNQLRGMNADRVAEWLRSPNSNFVDGVAGLREKLTSYGTALAQREGNSAALTRLQEQLKSGLETSQRQTMARVSELDKTREAVLNAANALERAQPENLVSTWNSTRKIFEQSGRFTTRELDEIGERVTAASRASNKEEQSAILRETIGKLVVKYLGLPAGALGLGSAAYKYFTGGQ